MHALAYPYPQLTAKPDSLSFHFDLSWVARRQGGVGFSNWYLWMVPEEEGMVLRQRGRGVKKWEDHPTDRNWLVSGVTKGL